jgi:hypothetical protein
VAVPVLLVRYGVWKPAKPVEHERPKDLVPKELKSGDPDVKLVLPEPPRLPPDAVIRSSRFDPPSADTPAPSTPSQGSPDKPLDVPQAAPSRPSAAPDAGAAQASPAPLSPQLPGEEAKK